MLKVRFIFLIAVLFTMLNSIFFLLGGVIESVHGYRVFMEHGLDENYRPGLFLLKSLDMFLVSMVFLIFGLGILRLFIHYKSEDESLPGWLRIKDFKELKVLLWETVIVTLVVFTLTEIISTKQALKPDALIMPGIILVLSISLFLMKPKDHH